MKNLVSKSDAERSSYQFWQFHNSEKGFPEHYPDEEIIRYLSGLKNKRKKEKKLKILDLAAGSGKNTYAALEMGFDVYCLDYSRPGLNYIKKQSGIKNNKLICLDFTKKKLPFKNNFFDGIIASQVIDHIFKDNVSFVIKEMTRVLKKNHSLIANIMSTKTNKKNRLGIKVLNEKNTYLVDSGNSSGEIHSLFTEKEMKNIFKNKLKIEKFIEYHVFNKKNKEKTIYSYFNLKK